MLLFEGIMTSHKCHYSTNTCGSEQKANCTCLRKINSIFAALELCLLYCLPAAKQMLLSTFLISVKFKPSVNKWNAPSLYGSIFHNLMCSFFPFSGNFAYDKILCQEDSNASSWNITLKADDQRRPRKLKVAQKS